MGHALQVFLDSLDMARGRAVTQGGALKQRAFGAAIPALGLSNKAVYEGDKAEGGNAGEWRMAHGGLDAWCMVVWIQARHASHMIYIS